MSDMKDENLRREAILESTSQKLVRIASADSSVGERLQELRKMACQWLTVEPPEDVRCIDRLSVLFRDAAEQLGLRTTELASFRRELLIFRRQALQKLAADVLQEKQRDDNKEFAAVVYLASQGDLDSRSALQELQFDSRDLTEVRRAALKTSRKSNAASISNSESRQPEIGDASLPRLPKSDQLVPYAQHFKQLEVCIRKKEGPITASDLAKSCSLPLKRTQWILEDLAAVGALCRHFRAIQSTGPGPPHVSEDQSDWRRMLKKPVRCRRCGSYFNPTEQEIFVYYEVHK